MTRFHAAAISACAILLLLIDSRASAAVVANRALLNSLLGGSATTEDFENLVVAPNAFIEFDAPLDSTSVKLGQGPGLVVPGIRFNLSPGSLQVYGTTVFGGNS